MKGKAKRPGRDMEESAKPPPGPAGLSGASGGGRTQVLSGQWPWTQGLTTSRGEVGRWAAAEGKPPVRTEGSLTTVGGDRPQAERDSAQDNVFVRRL